MLDTCETFPETHFLVNMTKNDYGQTPLIVTGICGHINCMKLLIENGADVRVQDKSGFDAKVFAMMNKHKECEEFLEEYLRRDMDRFKEFFSRVI